MRGPSRRRIRAAGALVATFATAGAAACGVGGRGGAPSPPPEEVDWRVYQGEGSNQYSALDQIDRGNVERLQVAWVYRTGDASAEGRSQIQANPIIVEGVLYATSPRLKAFALDAATGAELWSFDPYATGVVQGQPGVNRGVTYWEGGSDRRILFTAGSTLFALDAATGQPVQAFGASGSVDLRDGFDRDVGDLFIGSNTPGAIFEDLLILPTRTSESDPAAPGDIRAFDVRTGAIRWSFRTVPRAGQFGSDTWPADARQRVGGANNWAGMTVDEARGIVYVPTGSASNDFYGANRLGRNLFANTLLALDARTGERIWHYQAVRHDIWDRDFPAPPNLVTLTIDGERRDAVVQMTKSAHIFVFDRDTGDPLFPIDEVAGPPSAVPGEEAWPTQPLPRIPAPFSRQRLTLDNLSDLSLGPSSTMRARLRRMRTGTPFDPPSLEGTIVLPGLDGGGEWGGAAVDPTTGIFYVNASEMPWVLQLIEIPEGREGLLSTRGLRVYATSCLQCHGVDKRGDPLLGVYPALDDLGQRMSEREALGIIRGGRGFMPSFGHLSDDQVEALLAYLFDSDAPDPRATSGTAPPDGPRYVFAGYNRFVDGDGYPAIEPPWGTLTAIDLNTGEHLWQVPHGEHTELTERGIPKTGTENYGGPVVTAGGLIFIAGTQDERLHAYDKETGALLWEAQLPAGGYATPSTYAVGGRQFVVVAAGGGKMGTRSGDAYVAFALPEAP